MGNLRRKQIAQRPAQQSLLLAAQIPQAGRHIVKILRQAVIAEGHPYLQRAVHAHAVLPVQQGLHEPVRIEPHHLPAAAQLLRVIRSALCVCQRCPPMILHKGAGVAQASGPLLGQERCPQRGGLGPGESVLRPDRRIPEPGIAAENLVGTLAGQRHRHLPAHGPTKQQQRCVNIRHPRQVPGIYRFKQRLCQLLRLQNHRPVRAAQGLGHACNIGVISRGLEFSRRKITFVFPIVYGKGHQLPPLLPQYRRRHGAQQTGVQSAREKGAKRHVGYQLPSDRVLHQCAHMRTGIRLRLTVRLRLQLPIAALVQALPVKHRLLARAQFADPPEDAAARRAPRPQQKQLAHTPGIHLRPYVRMGQKPFDLRSKQQPAVRRQRVKKRLYAHAVPGQKQPLPRRVPHGKGVDAVELFRAGLPPLQVGLQQNLRVRVAVKAPPGRRQVPVQLLRIVKLSVIDQRAYPPLRAGAHRLASPLPVDHAQARMGQNGMRRTKQALLIRSPVPQSRLHGGRLLHKPRALFFKVHLTGNSAHKHSSSTKLWIPPFRICPLRSGATQGDPYFQKLLEEC